MKLITPAPRPDLDKALAAGGGGAVQVAVVPTDALRATAPSAAQAPAGARRRSEHADQPGDPVDRDRCRFPAQRAARLTIQAKDADAARKLHDLIDTGSRSLRAQPGFPKDASVEKSLAALTPQIAGDQLKLTLDTPKVMELAKGLGPVIERQREQAKRMASANNLRQLALAVDHARQRLQGPACRPITPTTSSPTCQGRLGRGPGQPAPPGPPAGLRLHASRRNSGQITSTRQRRSCSTRSFDPKELGRRDQRRLRRRPRRIHP